MNVLFEVKLESSDSFKTFANLRQRIAIAFVEEPNSICAYQVEYDNNENAFITKNESVWESFDALLDYYGNKTYQSILEHDFETLNEALIYLDSINTMKPEMDKSDYGLHLFEIQLMELPKIIDGELPTEEEYS